MRIKAKKLLQIIVVIVGAWALFRFLLVPPLLSDTDFSRAYYDRNNRLLRITLTRDEKYRIFTPLQQISPHIQRAVILYEDKHFFYHPGINPASLFRAFKQYVSGTLHPVGASTITMQVARLKYNINTKSIVGKLEQIALAIYIDLFYSKHEILEAYLNLAPYGGNIEGIGAASTIYFGKQAIALSKIEAITLATIPQNPTKRSLNTTTGLQNIGNMRTDLVNRWIQSNPNDQDLLLLAQMPLHSIGTSKLPFLAPHFVDYLNTLQIPNRQSTVITTLDMGIQTALEKTLRSEINARRQYGITNAAALMINYKTMDILAYIGSSDYFNREIYGENDGVRARRSPGSTLKPLIYANAVDLGLIHGMTLLKDTPVNFGVYAPENADNEFYGPVLARDALTHSRNIPAINLVRDIGTKNFYTTMLRAGISNLKSPEHYGVSVALGGAEVSMMELADIYATMANLGARKKIKYFMDAAPETVSHILSPEAYFLTLEMLGHQSAKTNKIPFAKNQKQTLKHYWKTGTSSSYRDAWTVGIFGDMVLIVWVGNFDGKPNNAFSGANAAAPIYFSLADTVQKYYARHGTPIQDNNFYRPELNVIPVDMCAIGGGIAGPYCPRRERTWFIPGKSPITKNSVFRMISIDNKTGLRACTNDAPNTHLELYEFWDAEYLDMFRGAGIRRKTAPNFTPGCEISETGAPESEPIILSPNADTSIIITSAQDYEPMAFIALGETNDTKINWFLDEHALGATKSGEVLKYNVEIGTHKLRATNSNGLFNEIEFNVVR